MIGSLGNVKEDISLVPHQKPRLIPGVFFRIASLVERPLLAKGGVTLGFSVVFCPSSHVDDWNQSQSSL